MSLSLILVESLPTTYDSTFNGARALPSVAGNGAYLQYKQYIYELSCTSTSCNWSVMAQKLSNSVTYAVMMNLPDGYTC